MMRLQRTYGDTAALARGSTAYIFAFAPEQIGRVLRDPDLFRNVDAASSPLRMAADGPLALLYGGLTNLNGPVHDHHRRIMGEPLHGRCMRGFAPQIAALTDARLDTWRVGTAVDAYAEMRRLTLAVAVRTLLGVAPEREGARVERLLAEWMRLVFAMPVLLAPLALPGLPYRRLLRQSEALVDEIRSLVAMRRRAGCAGDDVLSTLLRANGNGGRRLGDDELIGETSFLFMAGH